MFDRLFEIRLRARHLAISLFILGVIFCSSQNLLAQSQINESLVDLKSLKITSQINPELIKMGLKSNEVEFEVYIRLQDIYSAESNNNLVILVNAIRISDNYVSYSIEVSLTILRTELREDSGVIS